MRTRDTLSLADAQVLLQGARREAEARALGVSLAIVDDAGILIALERLDAARFHTPDVAFRKARTAAIARMATGALQSQIKDEPALIAFPDRTPIKGGVPITHEGIVVGAIGCSGGTTDEDVACCDAGLAAWRAPA